jgi:predicted Co/Zn/Cd cation transporter (cation efflux family)
MFLILAVVLVVLWLGGFLVLHISSFLIHLLLIFAIISIIMHFVSGGRKVV